MAANVCCWFTATPSCSAKIATCPLKVAVRSSALSPLNFADFTNSAACSLVNPNSLDNNENVFNSSWVNLTAPPISALNSCIPLTASAILK